MKAHHWYKMVWHNQSSALFARWVFCLFLFSTVTHSVSILRSKTREPDSSESASNVTRPGMICCSAPVRARYGGRMSLDEQFVRFIALRRALGTKIPRKSLVAYQPPWQKR